uniref:Uncharacterized protein n=1 Tax=Anguilla anguilla TaxID=7936 RepID=A0A0E9QRR4_ANGAN
MPSEDSYRKHKPFQKRAQKSAAVFYTVLKENQI